MAVRKRKMVDTGGERDWNVCNEDCQRLIEGHMANRSVEQSSKTDKGRVEWGGRGMKNEKGADCRGRGPGTTESYFGEECGLPYSNLKIRIPNTGAGQ